MEANLIGNKADARASLELLYHVSREIATVLDLDTLLKRVLYLSTKTIKAISGSIIAIDDEGAPVASALIVGDKLLDYSTEQLRGTLENGLAGWVVRNQRAALIDDTSQDQRWLHRPDDDINATGPKSAMSAPLIAKDRITGVITLVYPQPHYFTTEHLTLLQAIADQSAVAVLNARLHNASQRQARIMTALAESAAAITSSLNLDDVLQRILDQISEALDAEAVSLALINADENVLEYLASTSKQEFSVVGKKLKIGQGVAGWVAKEKQGVIVPDAYQDPRFYPEMDKKTGFVTKAIACAPIRSRGEVIGILEAINPRSGKFDPDALQVLSGIGGLAGSAIRHAQLFEALQAAHQRYHELFEGSINSIVITDLQGQIIEANKETANLSHYSKDVLPTLTIDTLHEINTSVLGENFEKTLDGETLSYESILHTRSGTEVPVTVLVQLVQIEGKSFLQWVFRDDTERKELDKLREDLLSMIYHDLRSPLANVVSSLDVLNNMLDFQDNPAMQSLFDIAVRSAERIQRLTKSLLDINRLEANRPVANKQPTSPFVLLKESIAAVTPVIKNKKQRVVFDVPSDIPLVYVNADMIQRVLINLIENAIKYSPPEGTIKVGARKTNGWVRFWIEDSGPGVPKEKRNSIFDKYTRLHGRDGPSGYGLGLAFCRLAVEGHGGKIWVEDAPGGGSHFTFTIPATKPATNS